MTPNQKYAVIGGAAALVLAMLVVGFPGGDGDDERAAKPEPSESSEGAADTAATDEQAEEAAEAEEAPAEEAAEAEEAPAEEAAEAEEAPAEEAAEAEEAPAEEAAEAEEAPAEEAAAAEEAPAEEAAEAEEAPAEEAAEAEEAPAEEAAAAEEAPAEEAAEAEEAPAEEAAEAEEAPTDEAANAEEAPASATVSTGQTAALAGGLAAFVSQIDGEGDRVRLSVNGGERVWVGANSPAWIRGTDCRVSLDGLDGRSATLSSQCGAAAASSGDGGMAVSTGQTAALDGGLAAFVSQIDAEGNRARLSVNGGERVWVRRDSPVAIPGTDCQVSLDGIEGRSATLSSRCGVAAASSGAGGDGGGGVSLGVGETAALADGAIRVFLSSVDAEGDRARVAVNGYAAQWIETGSSRRIPETGCAVGLDGLDGRRASISARCGQDAGMGLGEGDTLAAGETALLANETVRLFLSRVDGDSGTVRVAVNGQTTALLEMGRETDIEGTGCTLQLTGIDGRKATIASVCGESADAADASSGGGGGGEPFGIGQTMASGDLRAFVSSIDSDGGRVRLSVNGESVWLEGGQSHDAGNGCSVTLGGIDGRTALLSGGC